MGTEQYGTHLWLSRAPKHKEVPLGAPDGMTRSWIVLYLLPLCPNQKRVAIKRVSKQKLGTAPPQRVPAAPGPGGVSLCRSVLLPPAMQLLRGTRTAPLPLIEKPDTHTRRAHADQTDAACHRA